MGYFPKFADLLDKHLTATNFSAARLAHRLKVNPATVTRWRSGTSRPRQPEIVIQIADILGIHGQDRQTLLAAAGYGYQETSEPAGELINGASVVHQGGESAPKALIKPNSDSLPNYSYRQLWGRESEIRIGLALLRDQEGCWIIGVDGTGGIGKSAFVREVVARCKESKLFQTFIWINAVRGDSQAHEVVGLHYEEVLNAVILQTGISELAQLTISEKENRVRKLLQAPTLLILDNIELTLDSQALLLASLYPLLNPHKLIVTSRKRVIHTHVTPIHLGSLNDEAVAALSRQHASDLRLEGIDLSDSTVLKTIIRVSGGAPLAVKLLLGQMGHLPVDVVLHRPSGMQSTKTLTEFYEKVYGPAWENISDNARRVLISLIFFVPHVGGDSTSISQLGKITLSDFYVAFDELWRWSLVEMRYADPVEDNGQITHKPQPLYFLHPLTAAYVQKHCRLSENSRDGQWVGELIYETTASNALGYLLEQCHQLSTVESIETIFRLAIHVLDITLEIPALWEHNARLMIEFSRSIEKVGYREIWSNYVRRGIAQWQADRDRALVAELRLQLGWLCQLLGDFTQAAETFQHSLAVFTDLQKPVDQARVLNRLAYLLALQGEHEKAIELAQRSLRFSGDHQLTAAYSHSVLGSVAIQQERWSLAMEHCRQAHRLADENADRQLKRLIERDIAIVLRGQGNYEEAIDCYENLLADAGESDILTKATLHINLSVVYLYRDQPQAALQQLEQAEAIFARVGDLLYLAIVHTNQGIAWRKQQLWQKAKVALQKGLDYAKQINDNVRKFNLLEELGMLHMECKEFAVAAGNFREALAVLKPLQDQVKYRQDYQRIASYLREVEECRER